MKKKKTINSRSSVKRKKVAKKPIAPIRSRNTIPITVHAAANVSLQDLTTLSISQADPSKYSTSLETSLGNEIARLSPRSTAFVLTDTLESSSSANTAAPSPEQRRPSFVTRARLFLSRLFASAVVMAAALSALY